MIDDNDLKRCPFCGGKAKLNEITRGYTIYTITCDACGASTRAYGKRERDDLINLWNERQTDFPSTDFGLAKYYLNVIRMIDTNLASEVEETAETMLDVVGIIKLGDRYRTELERYRKEVADLKSSLDASEHYLELYRKGILTPDSKIPSDKEENK